MKQAITNVQSVAIEHRKKGSRSYDVIVVTIDGVPFQCDLTSDRHLKYAQWLAQGHQANYKVEPHDWKIIDNAENKSAHTITEIRIGRITTTERDFQAVKVQLGGLFLSAELGAQITVEQAHEIASKANIELYTCPSAEPIPA